MSTPTTTRLTLTRSRFSLLEWCSAVENACLSHGAVRRAVKMALDFGCAVLGILVAVAASGGVGAAWTGEVLLVATAAGLVLVAAHAVGGSYRAIWRYASLREVIPVAVAALVVTAGLQGGRMAGVVPLSGGTVLLGVLLMLFSCVGLRAVRRWQMAATKRSRREHGAAAPGHAPRGVLIVGAGEHGLSIGREIIERRNGVALAGYLDDDVSKIGAVLNGARVLGPLKDVLTVCETHRITEVIVAMPSADPLFVRGFLRRLEDIGIRARAVEGVHRFVTGEEMHRPGAVKLHELLDSGTATGRERPGTAGDPAVRRVLVTGGAGFIGSHLTRMLLDRGYHVRLLDRFDYGQAGIEGLRHPNLQIIQGDICNSRDVSRAVKNVDGVIALAAIVGDPACNLDPEETINLNYTATKILAETCNLYGVRRLVFASSCSVYGASGQSMLTEESRLNPVSLYARTRVLSENILFDRHGDVEPVVVRLATVFGLSPRMRFDLVVNTLTVRAVTEQRITIFGGNQWRPNVHCRDAARAFILALEAPAALVAGQIFNLGGDKLNHRISELGELVAPIVGGGRDGRDQRRRRRPARLPRQFRQDPPGARVRAAVLGGRRRPRGRGGRARRSGPAALAGPDLSQRAGAEGDLRRPAPPPRRPAPRPRARAGLKAPDFLVVGGGIIGVSVALELRRRYPGVPVGLLEKEPDWGRHASGRNSGVLHAGFYYSSDSLKARFAREGNRQLTAYCADRGLPINRCGKLVVARNAAELAGLDELLRRGRANGVALEELTAAEAHRLEPRATTFERALFSPTTASLDPVAVLRSLVQDARDAGVALHPGTAYLGRAGAAVHTSAGTMTPGYVVNAAGAYADRVAHDWGFGARYRILPFRGLYLEAQPGSPTFRTHIYPVPDLAQPFLGVHVTVGVGGRTTLGPTATPAFWREHYGGMRGFSLAECASIVAREAGLFLRNDFGFRRLALDELRKYSRRHLVALAAQLAGGIRAEHFRRWGPPGIRAQLVDIRERRLEMDFKFEGDDRSFHVLNAVSPGLTCALPFAAHLVDQIARLRR